MHIILVPGLWLDAHSWDGVIPALEAAGHTAHPLTMPGVGDPASLSARIGMADWVAAVVAEIDGLDGEIALVGHSGGGNVVWGALDARPDRIAHIVFLDTFPPADGTWIWEFPVVDGVVPFPGWEEFEEGEIADLDEAMRARIAARAHSVPEQVPTDPLSLADERRFAVPATMITGTTPEAEVRRYLREAPSWAAELTSIQSLGIIQLNADGEPTGHWPQYSQPDAVAEAIVSAVA